MQPLERGFNNYYFIIQGRDACTFRKRKPFGDLWETEFSIPQKQAEKRSGCLKPENSFLSVGRAAETFLLRHQRRLFHFLIRPAHPGIFLSYAEAPAKPSKRAIMTSSKLVV